MTNDLRVELRTRNNVLWHAIFDSHQSVAEFCRQHGLSQSIVGDFLNLSANPYRATKGKNSVQTKTPTATAEKLVEITAILAEDLFPPDLYSGLIPRKMIAEIPSHLYRGLGAARHLALPPSQDDDVTAREAREALNSVLQTLTPREEKVLRLRFGLDGGEEHTLKEVGPELGVGIARVRQIECKALRKLRHSSRARKLRGFLDSKLEETE